ncbi:hypothetical protein G647_09323 [Cladophialophora carrionii CBS 160.54]|uniref:Uncharacterized protein n=1 Tax=Cladophialophora carrionii CBS 160.54 TaxID=1279043 RepID=V9CXZ0_9EURO|nr:uncharacterized protein G647_09323 [Cladophialophora carrionii CBS 160.54]ETI19489.1 hypothetical protein G647_09323 [Cladophialophora carrionii CBS 160.54]
MASQTNFQQSFVLPRVVSSFVTGTETDRFNVYDVKFYPYSDPSNTEPVFAVVSQKKVYIARLSAQTDCVITLLHELEDEQEVRDGDSSGLNSCSWCYIHQDQPLLALAGGSGQLKVIDAASGEHFTTLIGHGHGGINDIATHPIFPWIVATASVDKSVRIWDLRRHSFRHESHTIIICGQATGHSEGLLTLSWHSTGRYLITGGHDHLVCVWTIPDLAEGSSFWREIEPESRKRSSDEVHVIHFPHFTSSAVHHDFVDRAKFFGDLVISKAAKEGKIVLWKITGFDTQKPPPSPVTAPKAEEHLDTRNGFMRTGRIGKNGVEIIKISPEFEDQPPFERMLEFEAPNSDPFYMRFGLLLPSSDYPELPPVLAFGDTASEIRFWDLERLALGYSVGLDPKKSSPVKKRKGVASRANRASIVSQNIVDEQDSALRLRESTESSVSNTSSGLSAARQASTGATSEISDDPVPRGPDSLIPSPDRASLPIDDPHQLVKHHNTASLADLRYKRQRAFMTRTIDWSPCGRWCIAVGESKLSEEEGCGGVAVLHR